MDGNNLNINHQAILDNNQYAPENFINPSPEFVEAVKEDIHLNINLNYDSGSFDQFYMDSPEYPELFKNFDNAGLCARAPLRLFDQFKMYLMARENNPLSVDEALDFSADNPKFQEYFKEFVEFAKANSILGGPEADQEHFNNIMGIFNKCAEKIGEYRMPDIDYTDPVQVRQHEEKFAKMCTFVQNFIQEQDNYLKKEDFAANYPGGNRAIREKRTPIETLQGFVVGFSNSYFPPKPTIAMGTRGLKCVALGRLYFKEYANQYKGKKINEVPVNTAEDLLRRDIEKTISDLYMTDRTLKGDDILDYLRTGNPAFAQKAEAIIKEARDYIRGAKNKTQRNGTEAVLNTINKIGRDNLKASLNNCFQEGKSAQELYQVLQSPEGASVLKAANKIYDELFVNFGKNAFYKFIDVNPLSTIRIDGSTLEELYGEKYASITDPEMKQTMYKAELLNQFVNGNAVITKDYYPLNQDMKVIKGKPAVLLHSAYDLERGRKFFAAIMDYQDQAIAYADKMEAMENKQTRPTEESISEYNDMYKALLDVGTAADTGSTTADLKNLETATEKYLTAVNTYYVKQENLMREAHASDVDLRALADEKLKAVELGLKNIETIKSYAEAAHAVPMPYEDPMDFSFYKLKNQFNKEAKYQFGVEPEFNNEEPVYDGNIAPLRAGGRPLNPLSTPGNEIKPLIQAEIEYQKELLSYERDQFDLGKQIVDDPDFPRKTMTVDAPPRVYGIFAIWAMGAKGLSVEEVAKLGIGPKYDKDGKIMNQKHLDYVNDLRKEFLTFAKNNPMIQNGEETKVQKTTRLKNWMDIFKKAQTVIGNYRLPDVDYADAKQLKPYLREICVLSSVGVNGVQESNAMMASHTNGMADIAECAGGEKEFWEMKNFFFVMQLTVSNSSLKGYTPISGELQNLKYFQLAEKLNYRHFAGKKMEPFRGKPLKELVEKDYSVQNVEVAALNEMSNEIMQGAPDSIPIELSISYLNGRNGKAFEKAFEENYRKKINVAETEKKAGMKRSLISLLSGLMKTDYAQAVINSADDAASMKALADSMVDKGMNRQSSVKSEISNVLSVFTSNYENAIHIFDLNKSDLFLVDGKKPSELWGEKYKDYPENEKEHLYRLEIIKTILKGSQDVKVRQFEQTEKGIREIAPAEASYNRERMLKMYDSLGAYAPRRDNLLSRLKDMKEKLLKTQKDKSANFGGNTEEGSKEYKNYTQTLQNVIQVLEREAKGESVTPSEIRLKLAALESAAGTYHRTHMKASSDNGILRKDQSALVIGLRDEYDSMRRGIDNNLYTNPFEPVQIKDAPISKILSTFNDKTYLKLYGVKDCKSAEFAENLFRAEMAEKQHALLERLNAEKNPKLTPQQELARKYLLAYIDARVNPAEYGDKPSYSPEDIRLIENFDEKEAALAADPIFQKYMTENPEKCIKDFHVYENRQKDLQKEYAKQLGNTLRQYNSISDYVADNPKNSGRSAEEVLRDIQNEEQPEITYAIRYRILGKAVVLDALRRDGEQSKYMRQEIALNPKRFDEMVKVASDYLRQRRALEGSNINKLSDRLADGKYTKDFMKHFSAEEVRARKEREEQYKSELDATEKSLAVLFSEDEDIELSKEDYTRFDEKAHYSDAHYVTEEFSNLGRMLWDIPPVSYKEDRLIKTTSPGGKEVEVLLKDVPVIEKLNINEVLKDGKISPTRLPTQQAIFVFWTIAKKGLGINDAFKICGTKPEYDNEGNLKNKEAYELSQEFRKEFLIFVRQNGTGRADARKETVEQSVKNWADVYKAGTQAVMNSAFPEGNYRNQEDLVKNMPALHQLIRLCIDVDQEFDSIFGVNNKVNTRKIAQKHLGGEKAFNELKNSWWALSGAVDDFNNGYGFMSPDNVAPDRFVDHSLSTLRNGLLNRAISRSVAKEIMNGYNGKTLGEISKEKGVKALYQKAFVANISSVSDEYVNSHPELTNEAVKYLLGKKGTFEQDIKPIIDRAMAEAKEQIYTDQIGKANSFKDNLKFENEAVKKLAAVPDGDLEAMKKFMEENVAVKDSSRKDVILSGADHIAAYISDATSGLFNTDKLTICSILGINASDTIRIDGKSPQEIWGEKYASITDPDLKEEYLRAEILKEMVLGRHTIEMRNFMLQGEELVEAPRQLIRPTNEKLTELCDAVHVYEAGREDILRELKTLKSRFAVTQLNPDANFTTGAPKEGNTEEYKELTKYLNNLIQILSDEKENVCDKKTILEQFDNFLEAAQEYEKTHTGLFVGRWGTHAKERVDISKDCQKIAPDLKEKYLRLRNGFDSSLSSTNNTNFRDGSYNRIVASVHSMEEAYPFLEAKEEGYYKQKYFEQEMAREIELLMNKPVPEGPLPEENYRMAREYLIYKYMQKAQDGLANAEDIRFIREADGRINELAGDKVFQAWAKTNKVGCFTGYEEIEKINSRGDAFVTYQETKLFFFQREERLQKDHGSLYAYVAGLSEANAAGLNKADLGRRADNNLLGILRSNNAENTEGIYDRLAEVILCQAAGANKAEYIPLIHCYRIGVFEENHEREELLKQYKEGIKEMLKEKYPDLLNLSEQNPKALEEFKQKIENGEFYLNNTDAIIDKVTGVMANGFVHKKNAPEAGRDNAQIEQEVLNEKAPQAAPAAPQEPEIDPAVKKLQDDQKEIEWKGENGKYNLESMGKGVYINGNLFEAKVRCAIDYIVAKEVELRGGLKQGESAVSIEKELFPTKNERAKLLGLLDSMEGKEFAKLVSDGKFKEAIRPKQEAIQNNGKAVEEGEKQLNEANHQNGNANQKAEGVKELKAPGMH